jgi:hypothetical protein
MSGSAWTPIAALDDLYRRAVESGADLDDSELGRWLEDVGFQLEGRVDREVARALRRGARNARRLARYWSSPGREPRRLPDWRSGVDEVLGGIGWRPHLDLARHRLATDPTPASFAGVKHWFRAVHFAEWMEGVSFEEWRE